MKKILIALLIVALAVSAFAGGKKEAAPAAPAASGGTQEEVLKGEVNLFAWLPDNPDIVTNWVKKFEAKYPGIKVNTQMMTGQTLIENLQPRFASNNIPDVFSFEVDPFSKDMVAAGKIVDISDTRAWKDMVPAMQAAWTHSGVKYGISGGICTTLIF